MPSVSTICVKPLHCPAVLWEACFLCNHFPVVPVLKLHPFLFSSFLFLGCQFHYPILYALKLARTSKSYTLANSDTPNSKAEFSIDTRWIPLAVRAEGQQWVTSITLQFGMWVSLTQGMSHRAYICAHGAHGPEEPNLILKKTNFELKKLRTHAPCHSDQPTFIWHYMMNKINLTNTICMYYRFYFYYIYF